MKAAIAPAAVKAAAIATVVIGADYRKVYDRIFRPSVERYAASHGYDLLLFEDYLVGYGFRGPAAMSAMKMLLPWHERAMAYDRLMVLDADILVHRSAPPFHMLEIGEGVGAVDEWSQPTIAERLAIQDRAGLEMSPRAYYARAGLAFDSEIVVNGGMFVCEPRRHGAFFRDLAGRHIAQLARLPRGSPYEQPVLNYELQTAGLLRLLPAAWNRIWPLHRPSAQAGAAGRIAAFRGFRSVYDQSFMLHMAAGQDFDFALMVKNR
jgi:hypothetical protein